MTVDEFLVYAELRGELISRDDVFIVAMKELDENTTFSLLIDRARESGCVYNVGTSNDHELMKLRMSEVVDTVLSKIDTKYVLCNLEDV